MPSICFAAAGQSGSPSPPPMWSPDCVTSPRTGGRLPGSAAPRSPPTCSGRSRRRSAARARSSDCGWRAPPIWRWLQASPGWLAARGRLARAAQRHRRLAAVRQPDVAGKRQTRGLLGGDPPLGLRVGGRVSIGSRVAPILEKTDGPLARCEVARVPGLQLRRRLERAQVLERLLRDVDEGIDLTLRRLRGAGRSALDLVELGLRLTACLVCTS